EPFATLDGEGRRRTTERLQRCQTLLDLTEQLLGQTTVVHSTPVMLEGKSAPPTSAQVQSPESPKSAAVSPRPASVEPAKEGRDVDPLASMLHVSQRAAQRRTSASASDNNAAAVGPATAPATVPAPEVSPPRI